ncbi:MAG: DUF790 family protein, partial [cyanobacterium endosymbiont of Rhopalodia fuxianensis]
MLPSDLLIYRYSGESIAPKKLPLDRNALTLASEQIDCFQNNLGSTQEQLNQKL